MSMIQLSTLLILRQLSWNLLSIKIYVCCPPDNYLAHFKYCSPLLVLLGKVQCNRLEDANYYISRSLLGHSKSVPHEQLLTRTDMSNLRQRRISQSLVLLFKCLYCNVPQYIRNLLKFRTLTYNLRGEGSILVMARFNLQ